MITSDKRVFDMRLLHGTPKGGGSTPRRERRSVDFIFRARSQSTNISTTCKNMVTYIMDDLSNFRMPIQQRDISGMIDAGTDFDELLGDSRLDVLKAVLKKALKDGDASAAKALMDRYDKMVEVRGNLDPIDYDILAGKLTDGQLARLLANEVLEV